MTEKPPALRFYEAASAASEQSWSKDTAPELLFRIGFPGLAQRLGYARAADVEEGFLHLQKLKQTLLFESAMEISNELTLAGVQHFFVKGAALLNRFYEPGDRSMSDIDIYVQPESRTYAVEILDRLKYSELPEDEQAGPEEMRTALALIRQAESDMESHVIDLHWNLDPVERLLPRGDRSVPKLVWDNIVVDRPVPAPNPECHAALLAHHLVHTDLLHIRNLLDIAYEFAGMPIEAGGNYLDVCRDLRIEAFGAALARMLATEFGIVRRAAEQCDSSAVEEIEHELEPESWMQLAAVSHPHDDEVITVARIRRRMRLIDRGGTKTLFQDLFFPPSAFLRWRWNDRGPGRAMLSHYGQLLKKAFRR